MTKEGSREEIKAESNCSKSGWKQESWNWGKVTVKKGCGGKNNLINKDGRNKEEEIERDRRENTAQCVRSDVICMCIVVWLR